MLEARFRNAAELSDEITCGFKTLAIATVSI